MRVFNVGIREVILLLVIMLILFGPRQMQENARNLAKGIRKFVRSDTWRTFLGLVGDVNTIKDEVIRESGIQDIQDSLRGVNRSLNDIDKDLRNYDPQAKSHEKSPLDSSPAGQEKPPEPHSPEETDITHEQ